MRFRMNSLRARLLLAAIVILAAFVVLTALALERAYHDRAEQAEQDKLKGLIYSLLGATDSGGQRLLQVNEAELRDPRLIHPDSGLYALILDEVGDVVWQSPSLLDSLSVAPAHDVGAWRFRQIRDADARLLFALSLGVNWTSGEQSRRYTFIAAESSADFNVQAQRFRRTLRLWLAVPAVLLLMLQWLVLHWGLSPLKQLVAELRAIEAGSQSEIAGAYPDEIRPLSTGLNAMLRNERQQQTRYRNALDDLAHSLKTPLAVLTGETDRDDLPPNLRARLREQLSRMRQIVDYQLKRAAAAGGRRLSAPIPLRPQIEKLCGALAKVYRGKNIRYEIDLPPRHGWRMDEGDLMEMLGNLLDNASKWCHGTVRVRVAADAWQGCLLIEDDGPGFPENASALLKRGVRADNQIEGQGIGLAVVAEILQAYEGDIRLERSEMGGGCVRLCLPLR
jgi:two-component system, OmpR family, sensor histidine kinase PhoQ